MYMLSTWGSKSVSLTLAFTGWEAISSFNGRGKKKTPWNVWEAFPELTDVFARL